MCLISVLPKGTKKDTEEVYKFIRNGAQYNTDGSGFMYKYNGQTLVNVDKGYFKVESMIDKIKSLKLSEDDELVIHHRIGTLGLVSPENTHPFVLSNIHDEVCSLAITIDKPAMVHNGHFSYIAPFTDRNPDFSDSYAFARYFFGNKHILGLYNDDPDMFEYTFKGCISTDKICILHPTKDLTKIGNFIEDNGYFHSNSGYCRYTFDRGGRNDWWEGYGASGTTSTNSSQKSQKPFKKKEQEETSCAIDTKPTTTGLEYLQDRKNIVLLSKKYVDLKDTNYNHFAYIRKSAYDMSSEHQRKHLIIKSLTEFDEDDAHQRLMYKLSTGSKIEESVSTTDLIDNYYYVPKSNYWATIYKDLKILLDFNVTPTLEVIRNVERSLNVKSSIAKTALDQIYYPKHCEMFCKQSMEMLSDRYRQMYYLTTQEEMRKVPEPIWTDSVLKILNETN